MGVRLRVKVRVKMGLRVTSAGGHERQQLPGFFILVVLSHKNSTKFQNFIILTLISYCNFFLYYNFLNFIFTILIISTLSSVLFSVILELRSSSCPL